MAKHAPTLADLLYRASFKRERVGGWRSNAAMREALVSARRFVLDDKMSSFTGDLSTAAFVNYTPSLGARMADQMRISARLPHRAVWIEYDLRKALTRSNALLGQPFDPAGSPQNEGWLLQQHPSLETAISMHVFSANLDGEADEHGYDTWTFPVMYGWTVDDSPAPWRTIFAPGGSPDSLLATGIGYYTCDGVVITRSPLLIEPKTFSDQTICGLVREWVGVVRRAWALLATLNDIPVTSTDVRQTKGFVARGRYRRFLDHKTITLHVPEKKDTRVLARQLIALARRRAHQVRGHWRADWRNPGSGLCQHQWQVDQTCALCHAHRIWVHEHQRGDASLGFVTHSYAVTHEKEEEGHGIESR